MTSEYTIRKLPRRLRYRLQQIIESRYGGRIDRSNCKSAEPVVNDMLHKEIISFDLLLMKAVKKICPQPQSLNEQQARQLISDNLEVMERAFQGTTLTLALVNLDHHFMWAAGVGDSTICECPCIQLIQSIECVPSLVYGR